MAKALVGARYMLFITTRMAGGQIMDIHNKKWQRPGLATHKKIAEARYLLHITKEW
jgi:hypothetical protein